jgi:hypothetical protein
VFYHPVLKVYLEDKGIHSDDDLYALLKWWLRVG